MSNEAITSEAQTAGERRAVALAFRINAVIEAVTWAGLLVAMLFKYAFSHNAIGVHIMGPIHGMAFLAYVVSTSLAARTFGWSFKLWFVGLCASIPPLATLPFERWIVRKGRLGA